MRYITSQLRRRGSCWLLLEPSSSPSPCRHLLIWKALPNERIRKCPKTVQVWDCSESLLGLTDQCPAVEPLGRNGIRSGDGIVRLQIQRYRERPLQRRTNPVMAMSQRIHSGLKACGRSYGKATHQRHSSVAGVNVGPRNQRQVVNNLTVPHNVRMCSHSH